MNYKPFFLLAIISFLLASCEQEKPGEVQFEYPDWVGDIEPDSTLDDSNFSICEGGRIVQYHNLGDGFQYDGEMWEIKNVFKEKYQPINISGESGWIRIRFVVNCEGKAGRFRLISSDFDYLVRTFDPAITNQLMSIMKSLDGWVPKKLKDEPIDYYQYLIFKIENGALKEIMP